MNESDHIKSTSLFDRIGGKDAVEAAVSKMYDKILKDPILMPFFKDLDMASQRRSQVGFIIMAFGGPNNYTGSDMTSVHKKLVEEQGLSDIHFDAVAGHLKEALVELNVPQDLIDESLALVETTRGSVLGRAA